MAIIRLSMYLVATVIVVQLILQGNVLVLVASLLYLGSYISRKRG